VARASRPVNQRAKIARAQSTSGELIMSKRTLLIILSIAMVASGHLFLWPAVLSRRRIYHSKRRAK